MTKFLDRIKWIDRANKRDLSDEAARDKVREIDESLGYLPVVKSGDVYGDTEPENVTGRGLINVRRVKSRRAHFYLSSLAFVDNEGG